MYSSQLGYTPVDAAIRGYRHKVVDLLLKSAANINIDSKVSYSSVVIFEGHNFLISL